MNTKKLLYSIFLCLFCSAFTSCEFDGDGIVEEEPIDEYENAFTIDGRKYLIDKSNCYISPETSLKFVSNSTGTTIVLGKKGEPLPTYIENDLLNYNNWYVDVTEIKTNGEKIIYHYEKLNSYTLINEKKTYWAEPDAAFLYMENGNGYLTVNLNLDLGTLDSKGVIKLYCCIIN